MSTRIMSSARRPLAVAVLAGITVLASAQERDWSNYDWSQEEIVLGDRGLTMDAALEAARQAVAAGGMEITPNAVGFDIPAGSAAEVAMQRFAQTCGGGYQRAEVGSDLGAILGTATTRAPAPAATLVVCERVDDDGRPVNPGTVFRSPSSLTAVYTFPDMPRGATVWVWMRDGAEYARSSTGVAGGPGRGWTRARLSMSRGALVEGNYEVVLSWDGREIARQPFRIVGGPARPTDPPGPRAQAPAAPAAVAPGPSDLTAYRDRVGQTFRFQVTGTTTGLVWGTGVYSDDSRLSAAAVHAGVLRAGQSGVVTVEILRGQDRYRGSTANGVTSMNWDSWGGSFRFVGSAASAPQTPAPTPAPTTRPAPSAPTTVTPGPTNLMSYRDRVGRTFRFQVTGTTTGLVYGTGVYGDDSRLSAAAVHAGVLRAGQSGVVTVEILPGRDSYRGSTANGVTSRNWDSWGGSFRFVSGEG